MKKLFEKEEKIGLKILNKYFVGKSKLKKDGRSAVGSFIKTAAASAALFTSVSVFADCTNPTANGTCPIKWTPPNGVTTQQIVAQIKTACNKSGLDASKSSTYEYLPINSPTSNGNNTPFSEDPFYVTLSFGSGNKTFDFTDVSTQSQYINSSFYDNPGDPNPESQIIDTPGVEAVYVSSGNSANIYCYINVSSDSGLKANGNSISTVGVLWEKGPCHLPTIGALNDLCSSLNSDSNNFPVDIIQLGQRTHYGNEQQSEMPVNLCACNINFTNPDAKPPRRCNPSLPATDPLSCNPEGGFSSGSSNFSMGFRGTGTCSTTNLGGSWQTFCW